MVFSVEKPGSLTLDTTDDEDDHSARLRWTQSTVESAAVACGAVKSADTVKNVEHLRADLTALRLMQDQTRSPKVKDQTRLDGGAILGRFWRDCKFRKKCENHPYARLLSNPILKADYRNSRSGTRDS